MRERSSPLRVGDLRLAYSVVRRSRLSSTATWGRPSCSVTTSRAQVLGTMGGLAVALARRSRWMPLRRAGATYVWLISSPMPPGFPGRLCLG